MNEFVCCVCLQPAYDGTLFPCCSRACENEYIDRRASEEDERLAAELDDPALYCGGERIEEL